MRLGSFIATLQSGPAKRKSEAIALSVRHRTSGCWQFYLGMAKTIARWRVSLCGYFA